MLVNCMASALQLIYFNQEEDLIISLGSESPLSIQKVYNLAAGCSSHQELTLLLEEYVTAKTALNLNEVCKVGILKVDLCCK